MSDATTTGESMQEEQPLAGIAEGAATAGRQSWLAALGLVALVGKGFQQGGRLFDILIEQGKELEPRISGGYGKIKDELGEVGAKVRQYSEKATAVKEKVEPELDRQVLAALERLGMPTAEDVRKLLDRVETLAGKIEGQAGEKGE